MSEQASEAFGLIADVAIATGAAPLNKHAGCWELDLGAWWIAVNGHGDGAKRCSRGPEVLPFNAYVEFNGWPAGLFDLCGGVMAAGEAANEGTLIEALRAKLDEVRRAR